MTGYKLPAAAAALTSFSTGFSEATGDLDPAKWMVWQAEDGAYITVDTVNHYLQCGSAFVPSGGAPNVSFPALAWARQSPVIGSQFVQAKVRTNTSDANLCAGLVIGSQGNAVTNSPLIGYGLMLRATDNLLFVTRAGGSQALLSSTTQAVAAGDVLRLSMDVQATKTVLSVKRNGVTVAALAYDDVAAYRAVKGYQGFMLRYGGNNVARKIAFSDFSSGAGL